MKIFYAFIILFLLGCTKAQEVQDIHSRIVDLNQKAVDLIYESVKNESPINNTAVQLLDSAIILDSSYVQSYLNKATIFKYQGDYRSCLKQLLTANKYESTPQNYISIALTNAKLNDSENFEFYIQESMYLSDSLIREYPDSIDLKATRVHALLLIETKERVQLDLGKMEGTIDEEQFTQLKELVNSFDRRMYIEEF